MPTSQDIATAFRELNFHDNTFVGMRILPAQQRSELVNSSIEIQLLQHGDKAPRVIRFTKCRNLRVAMDFDVLTNNLPPNTSRLEADTDLRRMRDLIESQKRDWDVGYGRSHNSPVAAKFATLDHLVLFRIRFFGGTVEVLATNYQVDDTGWNV